MLFQSALVASALVAFANAQTIVTSSGSSVAPSSTQSQVMPPAATASFNIGNTTSSDRFQWCLAQRNTCPQICGGVASQNDCDNNSLQYNCVCQNGTVPDCSAFSQTVPYFVCITTYGQCIAAHPNDAEGQDTCMRNQRCGTRNATAEALAQTAAASSATASRTSSSASSATGSQTSSGSGSGSGSAAASATGSSDASMTTYTTGVFAAVLMVAFKLLL
ncbi:hypothetical protein H2198_009636 [Neophaeococcomyces mojaviensis]|uniref:Uncharacterized protein n=1 Tax=Neophaeococcomyces mojaviensis TaxID=3383035 RepID=A0ACC2ZU14_9EURO|nr:hypothetical protein H2198_009636 [Knufia sp. JES_112]